MAMFVLFVFAMLCLVWSLTLKPGVQRKMSLQQDGNVVRKICHEMNSEKLEDVTQMDKACLVCLTEKSPHLEHC